MSFVDLKFVRIVLSKKKKSMNATASKNTWILVSEPVSECESDRG